MSKVLKVSLGCAVALGGVLFTVEAARDLMQVLDEKSRMGRVR